MNFTRVSETAQYSHGTLDVHPKQGKVMQLSPQFTTEFWMKSKFDSNSTITRKELFGLYLYKDDTDLTNNLSPVYDEDRDIDGLNWEVSQDDLDLMISVIGIYVDNNGDYIFHIGALDNSYVRTRKILKHKIDNKWTHIALVYDDLNETSCVFYLDGQPILSANMNSTIMNTIRTKTLCRFAWKCYKATQENKIDYLWLYNVNISQTNETKNGNKNQYNQGIRYNNVFDPLALDPDYRGLALDNDDWTDPIITPRMAHNTLDTTRSNGPVNNLVYLPMQSSPTEDLGSLQLQWTNKSYSIIPTNKLSQEYLRISNSNNVSYLNDMFRSYDENYDLKYIAYSSNNPVLSLQNNSINFSDYNDTGFTLDYFIAGYGNPNIRSVYDPGLLDLVYMDGKNTDLFYLDNSGYISSTSNNGSRKNYFLYDEERGEGVKFSYKVKENTTLKSFEVNINSLVLTGFDGVNGNPSYSNLRNHVKYFHHYNLDGGYTYYHNYNIYHAAMVFEPDPETSGCNFYFYINGNLIDQHIHDVNIEPTDYYLQLNRLTFNHFRISQGCRWGKKSFDPTTDNYLFIQSTDTTGRNKDEQKRYDINPTNDNSYISLSYPAVDSQTVYSRQYTTTANELDELKVNTINSNFHVERNSTHPNNLTLVDVNSLECTHSPYAMNNIQPNKAVTTNTYTNSRNIITFRDHCIQDKSWTIDLWVYLKKQIDNITDYFDLFYASGFGINGDTTHAFYNKGNGFIGIKTSGISHGSVVTNTKPNKDIQYPWVKNPVTKRQNKVEYKDRIVKNIFNLNDWNHIAITSDIDNNILRMYINGHIVHEETDRRFSYLHRLFLYMGNIDDPIRRYYTGLTVTMNKIKYDNENLPVYN